MKVSKSIKKNGFTLVELLVVISIILILMSILLPVIKKVKGIAGQGLCAKNLQNINTAMFSYVNDNGERLPFVSCTANLPNFECVDFYLEQPNAFGNLWEGEYFDEPDVLYCPDAVQTGGYGGLDAREMMKENFSSKFDQKDHLMCDYSMGFTTGYGTAYGHYPVESAAPNDKIENLRKARSAWTADATENIWPLHISIKKAPLL